MAPPNKSLDRSAIAQKASRLLDASPGLARQVSKIGATRQVSTAYYFKEIEHYVYAGDTALHIAAAAYAREISKKLLVKGANVRARNRRGAEPLHYRSTASLTRTHGIPRLKRQSSSV